MKIFVVGSSKHLASEPNEEVKLRNACELLGKSIGEMGHSLIVNSEKPSTVDLYFVKGLNSSVTSNKKRDVEVFYPNPKNGIDPFPTYNNLNAYPHLTFTFHDPLDGWRVSHLKSLASADLVIAIGGSDFGTATVVYSAEILEKPVIVLKAFKGAASRTSKDLSHYYFPNEKRVFFTIRNAYDRQWANEIIMTAISYAKRNPYNKTTKREKIVLPVFTILTLIAWLGCLFIASDYRLYNGAPLVGSLTVIGILATLEGALFRRVLIRANLFETEYRETSFILEWLSGLGFSSLFILFSLFTSANIANKSIEIKGFDDFFRIAITISVIAVVSSLVLELTSQRFFKKLDRVSSDLYTK